MSGIPPNLYRQLVTAFDDDPLNAVVAELDDRLAAIEASTAPLTRPPEPFVVGVLAWSENAFNAAAAHVLGRAVRLHPNVDFDGHPLDALARAAGDPVPPKLDASMVDSWWDLHVLAALAPDAPAPHWRHLPVI